LHDPSFADSNRTWKSSARTASISAIDHVLGDEIELTRSMAVGPHHAIPLTWVATVDDKVRLSVTEEEAKARWREIH
jgi:hypothetical protein